MSIPSDPNLALTYDPHAGQAHPDTRLSTDDFVRHGKVSGWVSTGFGLFQLLAPCAFLRAAGVPYSPWLIRTVGARDLALIVFRQVFPHPCRPGPGLRRCIRPGGRTLLHLR
jgi:hypothetical protein